jgi:hypothetical protein
LTLRREDFPPDDDGEVLFRLASKGVNLREKREIEFTCWASDPVTANEIAEDLATYGYKPRAYVDDDVGGTGKVSVYAAILMRPDHKLLTIEQQRLNAILRFHGTSCDGWVTQS